MEPTDMTAAGFWSYARQDDDQTNGAIRRLAQDIGTEYSLITDEELRLFIDRDIQWGEEWKRRIDDALRETTFFIPVITPRYFKRQECRRELLQFAGHARSLGRDELLLPIYYIEVADLDSQGPDSEDEAIALVARTQRQDWRHLRHEDRASAEYRKEVSAIAKRLAEVSANLIDVKSTSSNSVTKADHEDGPGMLELVTEAEEALDIMNRAFGDLTGVLVTMTPLVEGYGPKLQAASKRGPGPTLLVLRELAADLDRPAEDVRAHGALIAAQLVRVDPAVLQLIRAVELGLWESEDSSALFSAIREFAEVSRAMEEAVTQSVKEMEGVAMLSRDIKRPIRTLEEGLRSIADTRAIVEEWVRNIDRVELSDDHE